MCAISSVQLIIVLVSSTKFLRLSCRVLNLFDHHSSMIFPLQSHVMLKTVPVGVMLLDVQFQEARPPGNR